MGEAANGLKIPGVRKAAIAMILFGPELSGKLMKHLSEKEAMKVAREVARIEAVESDLAEQILQEYFQAALEPERDKGGTDLARSLLAAASVDDEKVDKLLGPRNDPLKAILNTLLDTPPSALAEALVNEHPQTTALVLLQLPPRRASKILRFLPEDSQSETILRMATLRQVPGEVIGEVASSLNDRLSSMETADVEDEDGFGKVAGVLTGLPRTEIRRLLEELETDHPEEVETLRGKVFTFESLIQVDERGMQELLRQIDSSKVSLALHEAPENVSEHILSNLSERAASMLREEIEYLGDPKAEDKEAARKELIDTALRLEAEGQLNFKEERED